MPRLEVSTSGKFTHVALAMCVIAIASPICALPQPSHTNEGDNYLKEIILSFLFEVDLF